MPTTNKQNIKHNNLKINPFAGQENLLRIYEIAKQGSHKVAILGTDMNERQLKILGDCFGENIANNINEADIVVEVSKPAFNQVINPRSETIESCEKRISPKISEVNSTLDNPSESLLKTAYDRLNLMPYEIEIIISVAKTIAIMDKSKAIQVVHIAEAIQYRSYRTGIVPLDSNINLK